jgi:hypothetical protein
MTWHTTNKQDGFATSLVTGPEGQRCRLICVPAFSKVWASLFVVCCSSCRWMFDRCTLRCVCLFYAHTHTDMSQTLTDRPTDPTSNPHPPTHTPTTNHPPPTTIKKHQTQEVVLLELNSLEATPLRFSSALLAAKQPTVAAAAAAPATAVADAAMKTKAAAAVGGEGPEAEGMEVEEEN